jgi:hypothetical protein
MKASIAIPSTSPTEPNGVVTRMSLVIEKIGIKTKARNRIMMAWRTMVFTRHRLIGSQVRESSRSAAMSEANPARLTETRQRW